MDVESDMAIFYAFGVALRGPAAYATPPLPPAGNPICAMLGFG